MMAMFVKAAKVQDTGIKPQEFVLTVLTVQFITKQLIDANLALLLLHFKLMEFVDLALKIVIMIANQIYASNVR